MSAPILVVGGGPAGLSAAEGLAAVGQKCVLVEKEDRLGGAPILSGYAKLVPSGEWAKDAIGGMAARVEANKLIDVRLGTTVKEFKGEPGAFSATFSEGKGAEFGAAVLCTGFTHFDSVNKPEWGFGTFEDVVTTTPGRADDLVRRRGAVPIRWPQAKAGGHFAMRGIARSADRPRMVFEDLLHGLGQYRHGDP